MYKMISMDFKCETTNDSMTIIVVISCESKKQIAQTLKEEFPDKLLEELITAEWEDVTNTGYSLLL